MAAGEELRITIQAKTELEGKPDIISKEIEGIGRAARNASRSTGDLEGSLRQLSIAEMGNIQNQRTWKRQVDSIFQLTQEYHGLIKGVLVDNGKILELDADKLEILTKLEPILSSIVDNEEIMSELQRQRPGQYQTLIDYQEHLTSALNIYYETMGRGGKLRPYMIEQQAYYEKIGALIKDVISSSENANAVFSAMQGSLKAIDPLIDRIKERFNDAIANTGLNLFGKLRRSIAEAFDFSKVRAAAPLKDVSSAASGLGQSLDKVPAAFLRTGKALGDVGTQAIKTSGATSRVATAATSAGSAFGSMAGMLSRAGPMLGKLAATLGPVALVLLVVLPALIAFGAALAAIHKGISMNIEIMDKFRQNVYRSVGTIRELTDRSFELVGGLGATTKEATAVIEAMVGVGLQNLKAADTIYKFSVATGVSVQKTAEFTKRMDVLGISQERSEALWGRAVVAQQKYLLSSEELASALDLVRQRSEEIELIYGATSGTAGQASEAFADIAFAVSGVAKQFNLGQDTANQFLGMIGKLEGKNLALLGFGGADIDRAFKDPIYAAQALADGLTAVREQAAAGGIEATVLMQAFGDANIQKLGDELTKLTKEGGLAQLIEQERKAAAEQDALNKAFEAAQGTLTIALNKIAGPLLKIFNTIAGPIVDAVVKSLNKVIESGILQELPEMIKEWVPVIQDVASKIGWFIGIMVQAFAYGMKILNGFMKFFHSVGGFTTAILAVINPPLAAVYAAIHGLLSLFGVIDDKADKITKKYGATKNPVERKVNFSRPTTPPVSEEERLQAQAARNSMHDELVKAGIPEDKLYSLTNAQMQELFEQHRANGGRGPTSIGSPTVIPEAVGSVLPQPAPAPASPTPTVQFTNDATMPPAQFAAMLEVQRAMDKKLGDMVQTAVEQRDFAFNQQVEERGKQGRLPTVRHPSSTRHAHGSDISSWNPFV